MQGVTCDLCHLIFRTFPDVSLDIPEKLVSRKRGDKAVSSIRLAGMFIPVLHYNSEGSVSRSNYWPQFLALTAS